MRTKEFLNFTFNESDKSLSESLKSLTNITNRSSYILMIYLSLMSFSFIKIMSSEYFYYFSFFASLISSIMILKNIMPVKTLTRGLDLDYFKDDYFEGKNEIEINSLYLEIGIYTNFKISKTNWATCELMNKRFRYSIYSFIIFNFLFFTYYIYNNYSFDVNYILSLFRD